MGIDGLLTELLDARREIAEKVVERIRAEMPESFEGVPIDDHLAGSRGRSSSWSGPGSRVPTRSSALTRMGSASSESAGPGRESRSTTCCAHGESESKW